MKTWYLWADVIRIVAIFGVVMVHTIFLPVLGFENLGSMLIFSLARTCVPLFVMLSGALLLSKQESYRDFFSKRFNALILPWIFWVSLYTVAQIVVTHPINVFEIVPMFLSRLQSFWFLPLVALLYLLTPPLRTFIKFATTKDIFYVVILWFLGVSLFPYLLHSPAFPLSIDTGIVRQTLQFVGFYLLGHLIMRISFSGFGIRSMGFIFLIIQFMLLIGNLLGSSQANLQSMYDYTSPFIVISSLTLFVLLRHLCLSLPTYLSRRFQSPLFVISSATLGIYLIHMPIKRVLEKSIHASLFLALAVFLLSCLCILGLQQIKPLKKYVS